jgi:hypothetical protein
MRSTFSPIAAWLLVAASGAAAAADEAPSPPRVDIRKADIESPTKALVEGSGPAAPAIPAAPPAGSFPKLRIEAPTRRLVEVSGEAAAGRAGPLGAGIAPIPKAMIERPTKALVRDAAPAEAPPSEAAPGVERGANPRVAPGKVRWHPSWEAALAASRASGKPVFLFQLLGQLDQRFT